MEFAVLLRKFTAWCKECQRPFYPEHLQEHGVQGINIDELLGNLECIEANIRELARSRNERVTRSVLVGAFSDAINKTINYI